MNDQDQNQDYIALNSPVGKVPLTNVLFIPASSEDEYRTSLWDALKNSEEARHELAVLCLALRTGMVKLATVERCTEPCQWPVLVRAITWFAAADYDYSATTLKVA